jgi:hypothetical protein
MISRDKRILSIMILRVQFPLVFIAKMQPQNKTGQVSGTGSH